RPPRGRQPQLNSATRARAATPHRVGARVRAERYDPSLQPDLQLSISYSANFGGARGPLPPPRRPSWRRRHTTEGLSGGAPAPPPPSSSSAGTGPGGPAPAPRGRRAGAACGRPPGGGRPWPAGRPPPAAARTSPLDGPPGKAVPPLAVLQGQQADQVGRRE